MFVNTGDYTRHTDDTVLNSTYYTFTPSPLTTGNFYAMDDALAALLAETHRVLGILEGISTFLPDKDTVRDLLLFRESCYSKMIDYPECDIESVLIRQNIGNSYVDIENITSAYLYAMETSVRKISINTVATYAEYGVSAQKRVALREKPIFLSKSTSSYRHYNPTSPSKIRTALNDITDYIENGNADVLVKAAMCHYQFEMIHPYERNNGIAGRILPYHILSNAKINGVRLLCLSASLHRHKDEYFDKLGATQKSGNYNAWINFFISAIYEATEQSISFIRYYCACINKDEERISLRPQKKKDSVLDVYRHFSKSIISTIGTASEQLALTYASVSRSVSVLLNMGILTQVNNGARNRHFAVSGIFDRFVSPE